MSGFTSHTEQDVLEDERQSAAELELHTGDPGDDGDENAVSAADYEPLSIDSSDLEVSTATNPSTLTTTTDLEFPEAESDWGTITHATLVNGDGEHRLVYEEQDGGVSINENDAFRINAGEATFEVN